MDRSTEKRHAEPATVNVLIAHFQVETPAGRRDISLLELSLPLGSSMWIMDRILVDSAEERNTFDRLDRNYTIGNIDRRELGLVTWDKVQANSRLMELLV